MDTPAGPTANKSSRLSLNRQHTGHFPPLVHVSSPSPKIQDSKSTATSSSKSSSHEQLNRKSRSSRKRSALISSAGSSLSSGSSSSASTSSSRASSRRDSSASLSSTSSSARSNTLSRNLEVLEEIVEEWDDRKSDVDHQRRLLSGALGNSRGDPHSPPPSRVFTGAHYLKWYIPPHIAGSRALQRSAKSAKQRPNTNNSSPLHNPEKQAWMSKLVDPKTTSLLLPVPHKPRLVDHSTITAQRADNVWQAFAKHQLDLNPSTYFSSSPLPGHSHHPPSSLSQIKREPPSLKSLMLDHDRRQAYNNKEKELDPLSSSVFTKSHLPVQSWFVVHPEWRREPGKRS